MNCQSCNTECSKFGTVTAFSGSVANNAAKTYAEDHERLFGAMTVPEDKALPAIQLLLEGTSIRSAERITELHRDTIIKLRASTSDR